ncbi:MAG TPA: hypothetical protein GX702_09855 [Chloroflexi bacterium]|jgi:hypothetical protein|nr:hypothetical protein [Chloroflexota bacterium]
MSEHARINDMLPLYVSCEIDDAMRHQVEEHLSHCPACRDDLALWRAVEAEVVAAVPEITPPSTVLDRALMDIRTARRSPSRRIPGVRQALQILRSQIPLVRREIWPASAAVIALGYIAALFAGKAAIIHALAPMLAAAGLAAIYGGENDPAIELTLATPTSPRQILLARMTLVFGYNLVLTLAAVLALLPAVSINIDITNGLLLSWLAPMAFLSALALMLSLTIGTGNAIAVAYMAWLARPLAIHLPESLSPGMFWVRPALESYARLWTSPALLLALAAALVIVALWRAGRPDGRELQWR